MNTKLKIHSLSYALLRLIIGILLSCLGAISFLLGASPSAFGVDRSPVLGVIQLVVLGLGLGMFCLGGCLCLSWLWQGKQISISADFGWRLVATGYVIALWSCMADIWGFGTSEVSKTLCFGPWQELGVFIGQIAIGIGLLLMVPWRKPHTKEKLLNKENHIKIESVD